MIWPTYKASPAFSQVRRKESDLQCLFFTVEAWKRPYGAPRLYKKPSHSTLPSHPLLLGCPPPRTGTSPLMAGAAAGPEGCYTTRLGFYVFSIKTPKGRKIYSWVPSAKKKHKKKQKRGQQTYANIKSKLNCVSLWFAAHPPQIL